MKTGTLSARALEGWCFAGFLLLFAALSSAPVSDGDFFWHIHSGQQILADRALPDRDTFSFTTGQFVAEQSADQRIPVILRQYWLAQVVLYGLHVQFGSAGIVVLRAAIFTAILSVLYLWGRQRAPWPVSGALTVLSAALLLEYPSERPQLFSFLLAVGVLYLLERLRNAELRRCDRLSLCLPLLMLLWGNLHGGYLLGVVFCALYAVGQVVASLRGSRLEWRYLGLLLLSAGIAFVNPCGFATPLSLWSTDSAYLGMVYEMLSPLAAFRHGDHFWAYWVCAALAVVAMAVRRRTMPVEHGLLLAGLFALSLSGLRYMIFLPLAFPLFIDAYAGVSRRQSLAAALLALLVFLSAADFSAAGNFGISARFPLGAADFLRENAPARRIYNDYDWGGYLGFVLPESRVFIDGRGLVPAVVREYNAIKQGDGYRERLRRCGANAIVFPALGATGGRIYPLVRALYQDDGWQLVYRDETALVFLPAADPALQRLAVLDKREIFTHVVRRVDRLLAKANRSERLPLLQSRAESQLLLGNYPGARESCRAILALDGVNGFATRLLAELDREPR